MLAQLVVRRLADPEIWVQTPPGQIILWYKMLNFYVFFHSKLSKFFTKIQNFTSPTNSNLYSFTMYRFYNFYITNIIPKPYNHVHEGYKIADIRVENAIQDWSDNLGQNMEEPPKKTFVQSLKLVLTSLVYYKLSRGEICVTDFKAPCEWCEFGQVFKVFMA